MKLEMTRVQILGLKSDLVQVLHSLHRQGCLHIEDISEVPELSARPLTLDAEFLRKKEDFTFLAAQLEGLLDALGNSTGEDESLGNCESYLKEIQDGIAELIPQVQSLVESQEKLRAEQDSLPRYVATLQKLLPILPDSAHKLGNISIGLLVSRSHPQVLEMISNRVLQITEMRAEIASADVDESTRAMLVVIPGDFAAEIEELLGDQDISRLRLPPEFVAASPEEALASIQRRITVIPDEIQSIEKQLHFLNAEWRERLTLWRNTLQDSLDIIDVLSLVGETEKAFIIVGWVPSKDFEKLQRVLESDVQAHVHLTKLSITHAGRKKIPVALMNPSPAKPFESLVKLISTPLYDGIDPSCLMAFFMPLFYGMMLGDVGYGLLLLLITLVLLPRLKGGFLRDIMKVLRMGSVWAIFFGLLFGELFGTLGEHFGMHPLWFSRESSEYLILLIAFSVGVGIVHITLGLILGIWEAVREKNRDHLLERGGRLLGLVALFLLVAVIANVLPKFLIYPGIVGLIAGVLLLGMPLGLPGLLVGPIEFISLIGNILSYMRIAAIGLASVYLAKVANDVAGTLGSLVVGLIIAVVIHSVNLVMGAFSPTIHSLRLHFVEFFQKFYEGGGQTYQPFRSRFVTRA